MLIRIHDLYSLPTPWLPFPSGQSRMTQHIASSPLGEQKSPLVEKQFEAFIIFDSRKILVWYAGFLLFFYVNYFPVWLWFILGMYLEVCFKTSKYRDFLVTLRLVSRSMAKRAIVCETFVETWFIANYSHFSKSSKCAGKAFLIDFVGAYFNSEKKVFHNSPPRVKQNCYHFMYIHLRIYRRARFCLLSLDLIYYFRF